MKMPFTATNPVMKKIPITAICADEWLLKYRDNRYEKGKALHAKDSDKESDGFKSQNSHVFRNETHLIPYPNVRAIEHSAASVSPTKTTADSLPYMRKTRRIRTVRTAQSVRSQR